MPETEAGKGEGLPRKEVWKGRCGCSRLRRLRPPRIRDPRGRPLSVDGQETLPGAGLGERWHSEPAMRSTQKVVKGSIIGMPLLGTTGSSETTPTTQAPPTDSQSSVSRAWLAQHSAEAVEARGSAGSCEPP